MMPTDGSEVPLPTPLPPSGLVLLNKKAGMTSFQALSAVKHAFHTKKVGHTGTLDSFATGLLVVLVGKMTRLAPYIEAQEKVYKATAQLGVETDTLDPEGEVVQRAALPNLEAILQAVPQFLGKIEQRPPLYSAIKVGGKRASSRIRAGESVSLPSRPITIYDLQIDSYNPQNGLLEFTTKCSKGTYVRSLARDLAKAAGSCAHLVQLERLSVGNFNLAEAVSPDSLSISNLISPNQLFDSLSFIQSYHFPKTSLSQVQNGMPIHLFDWGKALAMGLNALFCEEQFVALVERREDKFVYLINGGVQ